MKEITITKSLSFNELYRQDAYLLARKRRQGVREVVEFVRKLPNRKIFESERLLRIELSDEYVDEVFYLMAKYDLWFDVSP